uniref:Release factor glutamine methyltransferase n=1 Tax=Ectopseudomonas mendocina (strain ymp) TaxID=399739 RepID=A4XR62_ECTM1
MQSGDRFPGLHPGYERTMATIESLLDTADLPDSPTPRLDVELLLAAALGKPRSYLRTWPERELDEQQQALFQANLMRRRQGEPVAYILGHQGFWSLELEVAPHTLIPRPDTELLVETALELLPATPLTVLDLGTGTGAIALALASERPAWRVTGVDRVEDAVALAERNRQRLQLDNAAFVHSHWFSALSGQRYGLILSNPPYIRADDRHLNEGDVRFEPSSALVAGSDGLDDIRAIIQAAPAHLLAGGWLLLEHGFDQAEAVRGLLAAAGFAEVHSRRDLGGHERISLGRFDHE